MNLPTIYIAGPLSGSGVIQSNVANGISVYVDLIHRGYAPILPHLSYFADPSGMLVSWESWLSVDLSIIRKCDALLRLSGNSPGADREVVFAESLNIPVMYSVEEIEDWRASCAS